MRAWCCSVPSLLSAPLCQDLQGQPTASGISGPVIQGERIWYEAPSLGLAGKDQKLGRTRMGWSISLAWFWAAGLGTEFSGWMELSLENPHKPFQQCALYLAFLQK